MARISKNATALRDQLTTALAGATALGLGWPAAAATVIEITAARDTLATLITDTDTKEAAWKVAAQAKRVSITDGFGVMKSVDEATDLLYGTDGAEKNDFGLVPKGSPVEPLHKLISLEVEDGLVAGSLKFDWENIVGAAFEVQWSETSDFSTVFGSATSSTASDYVISGLTSGTQYWLRVRPVRGGDTAAWSDPATRIAPV